MSEKSLGQVAYEARELALPWESLSDSGKAVWNKVAEAVAAEVSKNISNGIKTAEKVNRKKKAS